MSNSIRSFKKEQQSMVVNNRLVNGTREIMQAAKEKRKPLLGLGYWGARDASNRGL